MYTTDAMGNLTQVAEPAPEGGTHLTTYAYNLLNQLTTVTMPRSTGTQTRTFNYDLSTARLTSVTNPESGTVTFAYNPDGTLLGIPAKVNAHSGGNANSIPGRR